jgi:hypothetical protein
MHMPGRRWVPAVLAAVVVSLAVASALHLSGQVHGRGAPFDADGAGIAEAVIGVVLAVGVVALWRNADSPGARRLGLCAVGFAIAGFGWGLSLTARGGHWPDIGYHLAVLPLLVAGFVQVLWDSRVASRS